MLMNGFFYVNILIHSSIDKIFDFVYFTINFISLLSRKRYMQILCFQFTSLYKDYVKTCIMILACCYLYRFIHFCTAQWNFFSLKWWNFVISYFNLIAHVILLLLHRIWFCYSFTFYIYWRRYIFCLFATTKAKLEKNSKMVILLSSSSASIIFLHVEA